MRFSRWALGYVRAADPDLVGEGGRDADEPVGAGRGRDDAEERRMLGDERRVQLDVVVGRDRHRRRLRLGPHERVDRGPVGRLDRSEEELRRGGGLARRFVDHATILTARATPTISSSDCVATGASYDPAMVRVASPTFVGRGAELAALDEALEAAAGGRTTTVLISGDPGVGKTRLLETWNPRARDRGARIAIGSCLDLGETGPAFTAVVEALREVMRGLDPGEEEALVGADRSVLARHRPGIGPSVRL